METIQSCENHNEHFRILTKWVLVIKTRSSTGAVSECAQPAFHLTRSYRCNLPVLQNWELFQTHKHKQNTKNMRTDTLKRLPNPLQNDSLFSLAEKICE
jgi:hypothetical protein